MGAGDKKVPRGNTIVFFRWGQAANKGQAEPGTTPHTNTVPWGVTEADANQSPSKKTTNQTAHPTRSIESVGMGK